VGFAGAWVAVDLHVRNLVGGYQVHGMDCLGKWTIGGPLILTTFGHCVEIMLKIVRVMWLELMV